MKQNAAQNALNFNTEILPNIDKVCAPLKKHYGMTLLSYRRFYTNGKLLCLFHNKDWMKHIFKNKVWNSPSFLERVKYLADKNTIYYLWPEKIPGSDRKFYGPFYNKNLNGITIYKKLPDCIEVFSFVGTGKSGEQVNNVFNFEKNALERFILYFKSNIFPLIIPKENEILIPYKLRIPSNATRNKELKKFLSETEMPNYYLRVDNRDIKLTKRQEGCMYYFSQGKRMKETGAILGLSEKTIEFYLRKIMKKLNCDTKAGLIVHYKENRETIL